jgi:hypothetical protein
MVYNNMLASQAIEVGVRLQRSLAEKRTLSLDVPRHCAPLPGVRARQLQDRRHRPSVTWLELPFVWRAAETRRGPGHATNKDKYASSSGG